MFSRLIPYGCLFFIAANAESSSSSTTSKYALLPLSTGDTFSVTLAEDATPTGKYISYASTITITTESSAITTKAIVSTITSKGSTFTSTEGSTTIFGYLTINVGNASISSTTSTPTQTLLAGSSRSSVSVNGTSNSTTSVAPETTNTTPCNNYVEFCNRKYGNITEVSTHNSPFIKDGNVAANQELSVTQQLNDGIRMIQGQMHLVGVVPHFCHTSCSILDAGPITTVLGEVYDWVKANPFDVVTILLGNGNLSLPVTAYTDYIQSTGLVDYAYTPPIIPMGINDWPTLESMILTGKRVVMFLDYNADQATYPWLLTEFSQVWETPFDPTDQSFPCTAERQPDLTTAEYKNKLYIENHNLNYDINILGTSLLVPYLSLLNQTNNVTGYGSLGTSTNSCVSTWGYAPKFLNVDFYNSGDGSVFEVAAQHNNVTYTRACCGKTSTSLASGLDVGGRSAMVTAFAVVFIMWLTL
ncbi:PLC-like phosphodiesterase [Calycina marina]|uniref:PLC-like phosphodiesterase n=1 Tax=Calycina marina TaxID=1763456 RepID=A0A9P8CDH8_9HELO|nr:PLC-like phosphodiesterase [Calycina marina]